MAVKEISHINYLNNTFKEIKELATPLASPYERKLGRLNNSIPHNNSNNNEDQCDDNDNNYYK